MTVPDKTVVTGNRNFTDSGRILADLKALQREGLRVVAQGGHNRHLVLQVAAPPPRSADAIALWATRRLGLDERTFAPDRELDGTWPAAGPRRNTRMLAEMKPDFVMAYPGLVSVGTWDAVEKAMKVGAVVALWSKSADLAELDRWPWVGQRSDLARPARLYMWDRRHDWSKISCVLEAVEASLRWA